MFEFTPLFWYKLVFLTELLIIELLFLFSFKKKSNFILRFALSLIGCYGFTFLFPIFVYNPYYISFMFLCLFSITLIGMKICFDVPFIRVLFVGIAAYTAQHIAYELYTLQILVYNLNVGDIPYKEQSEIAFSIWTFVIYIESYAASYAVAYLIFGSRLKENPNIKIDNVALFSVSCFIILVAIVLNAIITYQIDEESNKFLLAMCHVYNIMACCLALFLHFSSIERKKIKYELNTLQKIREQERSHYDTFKQNVDYINLKCHDLKHQIRHIANKSFVSDNVISELESVINIYDSDIKTGNETLDVILTEKRLTCVRKNITFSCIADGKQIDFMEDSDIYSLFGNALDNAIESVLKINDNDKRLIGLLLKKTQGFVSICIRNNYDNIILKDGDDLISTKNDNHNHGFGMKSMKLIVSKYDGQLTYSASNSVFSLNIIIPIE